MLAHMLKVSEGWLPTKPRVIGADRQCQHMPKAQFSVWLSLSLSSFDSLTWVNFLSCPYSDSISVLLSCSGSTMPQCNATLSTNTSLHSTSLFFFFFWLFSQKRFHFLIMSRSEGRRVSRSVGWPLSVGIMGITTVLTKWLLLDYSEPVTEQWLDQYKLMVNNFEHQTAGWI